MSDAFSTFTPADVRDLIAEYPLAWLVARHGPEASLLPLLGEYDQAGRLISLLGHMGRRNPLHARLAEAPQATILFNGPHGYVSPDQAERRNWGPTWNYAQLTVRADITFLPDEGPAALEALTQAMEGERWTAAELGPRYTGMTAAITAFRGEVIDIVGRFKLGQDEDRDVFEAITRNHPDTSLVRWMRRFAR